MAITQDALTDRQITDLNRSSPVADDVQLGTRLDDLESSAVTESTAVAASEILTRSVLTVHDEMQDFMGASGGSLPYPFAKQIVGSGGTPTVDFTGEMDGSLSLVLAATDEAEVAGVDFNDTEIFDPTKLQRIRWRAAIAPDGDDFTADERVVMGLATGYAADFDTITKSIWFRIDGGESLALKVEGDDGTTNTDDQATSPAQTITKDAFHTYEIDLTDLSAVTFYFDGTECGSVDVSDLGSSDLLQFVAYMQKDGGTEANEIGLDLVQWRNTRAD